MPKWESDDTHIIYRRFDPNQPLVAGLEQFALSRGITEAAITSCIGSLSQLRLRNLCERDPEGDPVFERTTLDENLELVSAEGYIQPLPEGGIRVHIHLAAARPSGQMIGGHCEEATTYTGAFMYLHVLSAQE